MGKIFLIILLSADLGSQRTSGGKKKMVEKKKVSCDEAKEVWKPAGRSKGKSHTNNATVELHWVADIWITLCCRSPQFHRKSSYNECNFHATL